VLSHITQDLNQDSGKMDDEIEKNTIFFITAVMLSFPEKNAV
jgi:hypothetical protein